MNFLKAQLTSFFNLIDQIVRMTGIKSDSVAYFLDILIFTLIIKLILLPLTIKQTKSTSRMTEFQSKFNAVKDKYKNDPKKLQQEQMRIQKELGVNPAAGCFLMLLQFPILIAMYWVIYGYQKFSGVPFLWVKDLFAADKTFILPIMSAVTQYIMGIMMIPKDANPNDPQIKQQKNMNLMMSVLFVAMLYNAKSALWLYWTISNLLQMGIQFFVINRIRHKDAKPEN